MIAAYVKGKQRIVGKNRVNDPGSRFSPMFPEICGRHCEIDVIRQAIQRNVSLRNGTMYVVGVTNKPSRRKMRNTGPCARCLPVLMGHNVRQVVHFENGEIVKTRL